MPGDFAAIFSRETAFAGRNLLLWYLILSEMVLLLKEGIFKSKIH